MGHTIYADCCEALVCELSGQQISGSIDGREERCPECGMLGKLQVDGDEDGIRCYWRALPEHMQPLTEAETFNAINDDSFEVTP